MIGISMARVRPISHTPAERDLMVFLGLNPDRRPWHFRVGGRARSAMRPGEPSRTILAIRGGAMLLECGRKLSVAGAAPVK